MEPVIIGKTKWTIARVIFGGNDETIFYMPVRHEPDWEPQGIWGGPMFETFERAKRYLETEKEMFDYA